MTSGVVQDSATHGEIDHNITRVLIRFAGYTVVTLLVLWVLDLVLPGFSMTSLWSGLAAIVGISLLNTFLRPLLVRYTVGLNMITFGLFSLLISVLMVLLVAWVVPGFRVSNGWTALFISIVLALIHTLVTNTLLAQQDRELERLRVFKRFASQQNAGALSAANAAGLVVIEVDGLSEPVLRLAIEGGHMPTLKSWLDSGDYRLTAWDASIPCMTSAMQAGILHGNHTNIPAFRYYDKKRKRIVGSNHPKDAVAMLAPSNNGNGLLAHGGLSVNNWACGNATESLLTFTDFDMGPRGVRKQGGLLYGFFADAYMVQGTLGAMLREIWREWRESRYQRTHDVQPRLERKFPYPLSRALTTIFLPAVSVYLTIERMFEGVATIYTTLFGYDKVSHYSGIDRPDTMRVLEQVDDQIRWISLARPHVARRYEIVLLADHGHSQGFTFKQAYGKSIGDLVGELINAPDAPREEVEADVVDTTTGDEGLQFLGLLLGQVAMEDSRRARVLRRALQKRSEDGYVNVDDADEEPTGDAVARAESVVCATGNLALVYLKSSEERMTLEEILARYPRLVSSLLAHPGIGEILVDSEEEGAVVLGKAGGVYYLNDDTWEEPNPLAPFSPHTARHLRELTGYWNCGDLVVFSSYDAETMAVHAFEEQVGSHGGLGGWQTQPFLMYPSHLEPDGVPEIVGAGEVYQTLMRWKKQLGILPESGDAHASDANASDANAGAAATMD